MANFELQFPLGGLNDNVAQSKQPSGTTNEAVNVRGQDPITGRIRGAQRSGLTKYVVESMEARVKRFEKVVYDNRLLRYVPLAAANIKLIWEQANTNNNASTYGVVDNKENLFVIDGGRVVQKWNKNGILVYTIVPPGIDDQNLFIRGLAVDGFGNIWISTGHANPAALAVSPSPLANVTSLERIKIWRYQENEAGIAPELQYSFSPKLAIEKLVLSNSILYACANDPINEDGYAIAYGEIYTTGLSEEYRRKLPYPLCDIDVDDQGKVYFTSPQNPQRYNRDSAVNTTYQKQYIDWTPAQIPSSKLWSWYDATRGYDGIEDGDRVTAWFDQSGNGRNLGCTLNEVGPKLRTTAWAGNPCLQFDGTAQLYTLGGQSTSTQAASQSGCAVPNYEGAKWAVFLAFRPVVETTDNPVSNPMYLFGIDTSGTERHDINATVHKFQNLAFPGTVDANKVGVYMSPNVSPSWQFANTDDVPKKTGDRQPSPQLLQQGDASAYVGAGNYRLPAQGTLNTNNNASILTLIYSGADTSFPCQFRLNGQPIDRLTGMSMTAAAGFYLGRYSSYNSYGPFNNTSVWYKGEVAEMIAVHELDASFTNDYPRTLGLACKSIEQTVAIDGALGPVSTTSNFFPSPYAATLGGGGITVQGRIAVRTTIGSTNARLDLQRGDVIQDASVTPKVWGILGNSTSFEIYEPAPSSLPRSAFLLGTYLDSGLAGRTLGTWTVNPARLHSVASPFVDKNNSTASLCEKIEGYLAWKWGIWQSLPRGNQVNPTLGMETTYNPGNWPHPFRFSPPAKDGTLLESKYGKLVSPTAIVGCLETIDGDIRWSTDGLAGNAGIGMQVLAANDKVYTLGDARTAGTANDGLSWTDLFGNANKFKYEPSSQTVNGLWTTLPCSFALHSFTGDTYMPRISKDAFGNVYYPFRDESGVGYNIGWTLYAKDNGVTPITLLSVDTSPTPVLQAAPERVSPSYRIGNQPTDDFPATPDPLDVNTYPRAENVYLLKDATGDETTTERYELVESTSNVSLPSPRAQVLIAISNGKVKKILSTGVSSPAGIDTLPQPELDATAPYIDSAVLFGKIYMTDGLSYRVYDPRNDYVSEWKATDAGSLPNRCKLLANWRGRAVLARGADDPHNWHMSEQGSPTKWDTFPPVQTATQAISGNNARAGLCPDLINSLIPYNDDLLLFGCDSSLWMMRGDPMAGGVFDLVSDVTGVAFGRSWAKDPEGTLYFFGSRGGVYIMKPGSVPVSMTQSTIERRLNNVNLSQFYVEMFWNTYDDGLHVFLMPFTDTASRTKHYFWERKSGAWYEDTFALTKQPSAAVVIDGDAADDRCLLIGTYDSSIVRWDKLATSDDGQLIDGKVLIGPIAPDDSEFDARITNLAAVMANQGAVNYKLYASTTPDDKGQPVASGQFVPGRNPIHLVRARGAFVWMELQQANAFTRWSLESMRLDAFPAGRKRNA
jgi:hypothetical protein